MRLGVSMALPVYYPGTTAIIIDDLMWELASAGNLTPLAKGTITDRNDVWDIDGDDELMPQTTATMVSEGYWEVDGSTIKPLDV